MFPFKLTAEDMTEAKDHQWYDFWTNLKQGYDWFEKHKTPPDVSVSGKDYVFK